MSHWVLQAHINKQSSLQPIFPHHALKLVRKSGFFHFGSRDPIRIYYRNPYLSFFLSKKDKNQKLFSSNRCRKFIFESWKKNWTSISIRNFMLFPLLLFLKRSGHSFLANQPKRKNQFFFQLSVTNHII